jgi:hypothetical protein
LGIPDVSTWVAWAVAVVAFFLGAQGLGVTGLLAILVLAIVALLSFSWTTAGRARRRLGRIDPRFRPTEERFHDPVSGDPTRVYVDPETGERRYWPEP